MKIEFQWAWALGWQLFWPALLAHLATLDGPGSLSGAWS